MYIWMYKSKKAIHRKRLNPVVSNHRSLPSRLSELVHRVSLSLSTFPSLYLFSISGGLFLHQNRCKFSYLFFIFSFSCKHKTLFTAAHFMCGCMYAHSWFHRKSCIVCVVICIFCTRLKVFTRFFWLYFWVYTKMLTFEVLYFYSFVENFVNGIVIIFRLACICAQWRREMLHGLVWLWNNFFSFLFCFFLWVGFVQKFLLGRKRWWWATKKRRGARFVQRRWTGRISSSSLANAVTKYGLFKWSMFQSRKFK